MIVGFGRVIGPGGMRGWTCPICGTNWSPGVLECNICNNELNWIAYPPAGQLMLDQTQASRMLWTNLILSPPTAVLTLDNTEVPNVH